MSDALNTRPDLMPETFHPPRWMVLTAGLLILAGGVASATATLIRDIQPRIELTGVTAPSANRANEAVQAVSVGSYVLNQPKPEPVRRAEPKVEEVIEEVAPITAPELETTVVAPEPTPPDAPVLPAPPF